MYIFHKKCNRRKSQDSQICRFSHVRFDGSCLIHGPVMPALSMHSDCNDLTINVEEIDEMKRTLLRNTTIFSHSKCPPEVHRSCYCVRFIAEHTRMLEDSTKVKNFYSCKSAMSSLSK